jgi:Flp pilus assembly protein TadG
MAKKEKKGEGYKVAFFTLLFLIVIAAIAAGIFAYGKHKLNQGKQLAFSAIVENVNKSGYVVLVENEQNISIALVPASLVDLAAQQARQQAILEIIETAKSQGYVSLYSNLSGNYTEVLLVLQNVRG